MGPGKTPVVFVVVLAPPLGEEASFTAGEPDDDVPEAGVVAEPAAGAARVALGVCATSDSLRAAAGLGVVELVFAVEGPVSVLETVFIFWW